MPEFTTKRAGGVRCTIAFCLGLSHGNIDSDGSSVAAETVRHASSTPVPALTRCEKNRPAGETACPTQFRKPLHSKRGGADGFVCRAARNQIFHTLAFTGRSAGRNLLMKFVSNTPATKSGS